MEKLILIYLVAVNVFTFFTFALDKYKAKRNLWRIPERALLGLAAIGGTIGAFAAMKMLHHKTLHKKFTIGIPTIFILQIVLACYFYNK